MYIKSNLILKVGYSNLECEKNIFEDPLVMYSKSRIFEVVFAVKQKISL